VKLGCAITHLTEPNPVDYEKVRRKGEDTMGILDLVLAAEYPENSDKRKIVEQGLGESCGNSESMSSFTEGRR
jgi:hypothetical protein